VKLELLEFDPNRGIGKPGRHAILKLILSLEVRIAISMG
jgi:hypothetical protein